MTQLAFIIAGSEATGGAGIQADLRTFQQLGVYGLGTVTCIVSFDPKDNWNHRFVPVDRHPEIVSRLAAGAPAEAVLDELAEAPGDSSLACHIDIVQRCFSLPSIADMKEALRREKGDFAAEALVRLERAAPSSLAVTMNLLDRTAGLSLSECLAIELDLAKQVTRSPDFAEGIRAVLVDKDRNPQWASGEAEMSL